jgi:hypothetical protein
MVDQFFDFIFDSGLFIVLVFAIPLALVVMQWRLISRTQGVLRWLAAGPALILAAFIVLNAISPSNIWPIALIVWTLIALMALLRRPVPPGTIWACIKPVDGNIGRPRTLPFWKPRTDP